MRSPSTGSRREAATSRPIESESQPASAWSEAPSRDNFFGGNRGHTYLGNPDNRAQIYPDYVRVCNSFNVPCEQVMYRRDLRAALQRMRAGELSIKPGFDGQYGEVKIFSEEEQGKQGSLF